MDKFCINCTHFRAPDHSMSVAEYGKCQNQRIMTFSPVTGEMVPKFAGDFAISLRRDDKQCGKDGAWFEPKNAAQPAPAESCSEVGNE